MSENKEVPDSYWDWYEDLHRNPRNIPRDIKDED